MKLNSIPTALILALGVLSAPTAGAQETNQWSFSLTPYLWVADIELSAGRPPSAPPAVDRFDTRISAGAMIAAQARYRSVGFLTDFAWLRLDTKAINPGPAFSDVDLKSDFMHLTTALTYRLPLRGKFHADALAGARIWHVANALTFSPGLLPGMSASQDKTWADPVIGADLRYDLSRRWSLQAKGTVGGFGVGADLAWEAFGGASYRITDWCSATAGYRYLREDYSRSNFDYKLDAHGVLVGFGFHF